MVNSINIKGFDISFVARFAGIDNSALHHVFEKIVGRSPVRCLKKIRLHQARLMTVNNDLCVCEAAHKLGFNNASQFSW
ncbi:MAG: helix-turn-helix transcriptional regulator [Deltaproteobacteria bacterium]|nr:helix-turn-helix transcriptional regulator [Deltaproteobacteria bacterium]MBW2488137.1 helix-turn-helix transcriptional regulator [Deltaproteobacteria bacterium]MBW2516078.1 helix-turn-helix transcriptional regulator [Deltaproteobacteria bacterium]